MFFDSMFQNHTFKIDFSTYDRLDQFWIKGGSAMDYEAPVNFNQDFLQ